MENNNGDREPANGAVEWGQGEVQPNVEHAENGGPPQVELPPNGDDAENEDQPQVELQPNGDDAENEDQPQVELQPNGDDAENDDQPQVHLQPNGFHHQNDDEVNLNGDEGGEVQPNVNGGQPQGPLQPNGIPHQNGGGHHMTIGQLFLFAMLIQQYQQVNQNDDEGGEVEQNVDDAEDDGNH